MSSSSSSIEERNKKAEKKTLDTLAKAELDAIIHDYVNMRMPKFIETLEGVSDNAKALTTVEIKISSRKDATELWRFDTVSKSISGKWAKTATSSND